MTEISEEQFAPEPPVKAKKPIWQRWWFIALAVIIVIVVFAQRGNSNSGTPSNSPSASDSPAPNYDGVAAAAAFEAEWMDVYGVKAWNEFESCELDAKDREGWGAPCFTSIASPEKGVIEAQLDAVGITEPQLDRYAKAQLNLVNTDGKLADILRIISADGVTGSSDAEPPKTTTAGLGSTAAHVACQNRANREYPYGANIHSVMGVISDGVNIDKDQWFWKVEITVTNAFNAKQEGILECSVAGTNDAPQVVGFDTYRK